MMRKGTAFGQRMLHRYADVARYSWCYDSAVIALAFSTVMERERSLPRITTRITCGCCER